MLFTRSQYLFITLSLLFFVSCKKRNEFNNETAQVTVDLQNTCAHLDEIVIDANKVIADHYPMRGRVSGSISNSMCGVTPDTSLVYNGSGSGIITLTYNGQTCNNRTKTGVVSVSIQNYPTAKWKQKGCVVKLVFSSYRVVYSDARSIIFNGTLYMKNNTGGTWYDMYYLNQSQVGCEVTGDNLLVKYDNSNTSSVLNFSRRYMFTLGASNVVTASIDGVGDYNGHTVDVNGLAREGEKFYSMITTPVVWRTDCTPYSPVDGVTNVQREDRDYTFKCLYGYDGAGNFLGNTAGSCPAIFRVSWSFKRSTNERNFDYYR